MSRIRIKNFGPIKEGYLEDNGWIDVKKVTVFIGNQGSGKSTVAKLISTFTWFEKAITRGEFAKTDFKRDDVYKGLQYHRIYNYHKKYLTEIEYEGENVSIKYNKNELEVIIKNNIRYSVPKIMYVPAERNFLSVIEEAESVVGLPKPLYTFSAELSRSRKELKNEVPLPISGLSFSYDKTSGISDIIGEDYKVNLLEASSGMQSFVPLFLVSRNLASLINRKKDNSKMNISVSQAERRDKEIEEVLKSKKTNETNKMEMIAFIKAKYQSHCFINIVEEPEQNLFPSSQKQVLESLLEINNLNDGNKLIMTTHSPYLINYLTLAVEADKLKERVKTPELIKKLNIIVPLNSTLNGDGLVIYQLDEKEGVVTKLKTYKGLPSDENYLNMGLAESNDLFSELLDIEDLCQ